MSSSATRVPSAEEGAGWVHFTFPEGPSASDPEHEPARKLNRELNNGD